MCCYILKGKKGDILKKKFTNIVNIKLFQSLFYKNEIVALLWVTKEIQELSRS